MAKPRKKKGALLKLVGTGVLLLSFATQNFLYQAWDARSTELTTAMRDRALIDKGALLNELLYFAARTSGGGSKLDAVAASKVSQAANKIALSQAVALLTIDSLSTAEKTRLTNELLAEARAVQDYDGLLALFATVNDQYGKYSDQLNVEYGAIRAKRSAARWFYLVLYALGSVVVLLGLIFDWRGAEE